MQKTIPNISNQIRSEEVHNLMEDNFKEVSFFWANHQLEWINGAYRSFKDHDKFLHMLKQRTEQQLKILLSNLGLTCS